MKEVDQNTGEDLNPNLPPVAADSNGVYSRDDVPNLEMPWMNPEITTQPTSNVNTSNKRARIRLSTPERWELRQMQGGGAISQIDFPDFDEELGVLKNFDGIFFF